ncbi:MAG: hypothetical protein E4G89_00345 [Methanothrix sp.]|nr:MAG: hypothetical protein E4G89_00345 [Methanothrix sp.]
MLMERDDRPGGEGPHWLGQYILDDENVPVECYDLLAWGIFMQNIERRRVAGTAFPQTGSLWLRPWAPTVSTVFLGLDSNFHNDGPPVLFETMIFRCRRNGLDGYQVRCSTWAEAEEMHAYAIAYLIHTHWLPDTLRNFLNWSVLDHLKKASKLPWRYWRDRLLNRHGMVRVDGIVHKAFIVNETTLMIPGKGPVVVTNAPARLLTGVAPRGTDKWLLMCSSAASRTRSALKKFSFTRSSRRRSDQPK